MHLLPILNDWNLPESFPSPFSESHPHILAQKASESLQYYLTTQSDFVHNFGLDSAMSGMVIGKMFGVLVVKSLEGQLGYLAAVSGKLAGRNDQKYFVPPVYDLLAEDSFFIAEEVVINDLNFRISDLESKLNMMEKSEGCREQIQQLKQNRKKRSSALQQKIFEQYIFLNSDGDKKNLLDIFKCKQGGVLPPAGTGECAAPKLLQYAYQHCLEPIAMAEFWWGASPKADLRKHLSYYPACREKCGPLLEYMLRV